MKEFELGGRVAIVTGGASGIGRAVAGVLAEAGATVIVADRDIAGASEVAEGLGGAALALDVTDPEAVDRAALDVTARYGPPAILINNAGIVHNAPALDMATADWARVIDVNLNGVFYCARAFGREMVAARRGAIVNISSICGQVTVHPQPQVAYNAAKAGVDQITRSLAVEWAACGVRVNAVAPGYTATELTLAGRSRPDWFDTWLRATPMARMADPREIAMAVLFLASDAASYITGTVLTVDGGYTAI